MAPEGLLECLKTNKFLHVHAWTVLWHFWSAAVTVGHLWIFDCYAQPLCLSNGLMTHAFMRACLSPPVSLKGNP